MCALFKCHALLTTKSFDQTSSLGVLSCPCTYRGTSNRGMQGLRRPVPLVKNTLIFFWHFVPCSQRFPKTIRCPLSNGYCVRDYRSLVIFQTAWWKPLSNRSLTTDSRSKDINENKNRLGFCQGFNLSIFIL